MVNYQFTYIILVFCACWILAQEYVYNHQQSPVYYHHQQSPIYYQQQSPVYYQQQQSPVYYQQQQSPVYYQQQQSPVYYQQQSPVYYQQQSPVYYQQQSPFYQQQSLYNSQRNLINPLMTFSIGQSSLSSSPLVGYSCQQGRKEVDEDRYMIDNERQLYGVYDGHMGFEAADFVSKNIKEFFFNELEKFSYNITQVFVNTYRNLDVQFDNEIDATSGTTALTAFLDGHNLYVANVGDSKSVLCCNNIFPIEISEVHSAANPLEAARTKNKLYVWTRSIGDPHLTNHGMIPDPDVRKTRILSSSKFLILATDGVWDMITTEKAVQIVNGSFENGDNPGGAAEKLSSEVYNMGSRDNICIIVVQFE